MPNKVRSADC